MEKNIFSKLCKENGVTTADLPAFPPKLTDDQWVYLIRAIGKAKKSKSIVTQS